MRLPCCRSGRDLTDGVEDLTHGVGAGPAGLSGGPVFGREEGFDVVPLGVREIAGVRLPCFHPDRLREDPGFWEDQLLYGL